MLAILSNVRRTFVSDTKLSNSNFHSRGVGVYLYPMDLSFTHNRHLVSYAMYQMMITYATPFTNVFPWPFNTQWNICMCNIYHAQFLYFIFFSCLFEFFQSVLYLYFIILQSTRHDVLPSGERGRDAGE